jgi:hypothetical protein
VLWVLLAGYRWEPLHGAFAPQIRPVTLGWMMESLWWFIILTNGFAPLVPPLDARFAVPPAAARVFAAAMSLAVAEAFDGEAAAGVPLIALLLAAEAVLAGLAGAAGRPFPLAGADVVVPAFAAGDDFADAFGLALAAAFLTAAGAVDLAGAAAAFFVTAGARTGAFALPVVCFVATLRFSFRQPVRPVC